MFAEFPEGYTSGEQLIVYGTAFAIVVAGLFVVRWLKNKLLAKKEEKKEE